MLQLNVGANPANGRGGTTAPVQTTPLGHNCHRRICRRSRKEGLDHCTGIDLTHPDLIVGSSLGFIAFTSSNGTVLNDKDDTPDLKALR